MMPHNKFMIVTNTDVQLKFIQTHADAVLPQQKHIDKLTGDSGYDVTAVEDIVIPARGAAVVPVGLQLAEVPPGIWIRIESRSGTNFKHLVSAFSGIIDNQYRGSLDVQLNNRSDVDYQVKKGDRIAQLVMYPLIVVDTAWAEQATPTDRGAQGFGSTGR